VDGGRRAAALLHLIPYCIGSVSFLVIRLLKRRPVSGREIARFAWL
jgi:hypothetical protein